MSSRKEQVILLISHRLFMIMPKHPIHQILTVYRRINWWVSVCAKHLHRHKVIKWTEANPYSGSAQVIEQLGLVNGSWCRCSRTTEKWSCTISMKTGEKITM